MFLSNLVHTTKILRCLVPNLVILSRLFCSEHHYHGVIAMMVDPSVKTKIQEYQDVCLKESFVQGEHYQMKAKMHFYLEADLLKYHQ
jgi:hypothetical protein